MRSKEWSEKGQFSSFNSIKGLTYIDHYQGVIDGKLLPPIEASIDSASVCQLSCKWCNAYSFLSRKGSLYDKIKNPIMPRSLFRDLVNFLIDWGVRGICAGGGGDPSLNPACPEMIELTVNRGREFAFVTNGISISSALMDALLLCRWAGFSVDAASNRLYKELKGMDCLDVVLANISTLAKNKREDNAGVEISYKMLIVPKNVHEIVDACKLAKDIGVDIFHARPASVEGREVFSGIQVEYDVHCIMDLFEECHDMETENFRVITSYHKFSRDFKRENNFSHCLAGPVHIQCCADGYCYSCQDNRIKPEHRIGSYVPDPKQILDFWGSEEHLRILKSINPQDCPRCTLTPYQRYAEEVCLKDSLMVNFP